MAKTSGISLRAEYWIIFDHSWLSILTQDRGMVKAKTIANSIGEEIQQRAASQCLLLIKCQSKCSGLSTSNSKSKYNAQFVFIWSCCSSATTSSTWDCWFTPVNNTLRVLTGGNQVLGQLTKWIKFLVPFSKLTDDYPSNITDWGGIGHNLNVGFQGKNIRIQPRCR